MWQTLEKYKPTLTVHWVPCVLISSCERQGLLCRTNDRQFTGRSNHSSPISGWEYWTRRGNGKASGLQWPCNCAILRSSVTAKTTEWCFLKSRSSAFHGSSGKFRHQPHMEVRCQSHTSWFPEEGFQSVEMCLEGCSRWIYNPIPKVETITRWLSPLHGIFWFCNCYEQWAQRLTPAKRVLQGRIPINIYINDIHTDLTGNKGRTTKTYTLERCSERNTPDAKVLFFGWWLFSYLSSLVVSQFSVSGYILCPQWKSSVFYFRGSEDAIHCDMSLFSQ